MSGSGFSLTDYEQAKQRLRALALAEKQKKQSTATFTTQIKSNDEIMLNKSLSPSHTLQKTPRSQPSPKTNRPNVNNTDSRNNNINENVNGSVQEEKGNNSTALIVLDNHNSIADVASGANEFSLQMNQLSTTLLEIFAKFGY
jgi:hypothetical protein